MYPKRLNEIYCIFRMSDFRPRSYSIREFPSNGITKQVSQRSIENSGHETNTAIENALDKLNNLVVNPVGLSFFSDFCYMEQQLGHYNVGICNMCVPETGEAMSGNEIFVPMDWPVGRFKKLLLSLAKKVIDDVVSDQIIVLQVNRVPTTLARYQDESRAYYVFEKVRDQELTDAYMIDVIISKNIIKGRNSTGAGTSTAENASAKPVDENSNNDMLFDDYVICTYQTDNRTAYYVVPPTQFIQTMRPERNITRATHQRTSGGIERCSLFRII
ncbi:orph-X1 [Microplitis demolitor]|uniref:uncharacterized LOC103571336 n=1 Tax=Microplitis demolitor TaxID=69319 RepID=UPI0004CC9AB9|nr:uncharacterized LOC103571336 [Microplitis demolitor]KAG6558380.1 orph-X1 [Microplitis demolitor]